MTREQFYEAVGNVYGILEFCQQYDIGFCDDWMDDDAYDAAVCDDIRDATETRTWNDIRDYLDDLPSGYDYYTRTGAFDYSGIDDDDFDYIRDDLEQYLDSIDFFDGEAEEDETDEEIDDAVAESASEEISEWDRTTPFPEKQPVQTCGDVGSIQELLF